MLYFFFSMGTFEIELYWNHAPKTCANFAELCRRGYYNKTKFHRIIKDFMIQGGDPTATGDVVTDVVYLYLAVNDTSGPVLNKLFGVFFCCQ